MFRQRQDNLVRSAPCHIDLSDRPTSFNLMELPRPVDVAGGVKQQQQQQQLQSRYGEVKVPWRMVVVGSVAVIAVVATAAVLAVALSGYSASPMVAPTNHQESARVLRHLPLPPFVGGPAGEDFNLFRQVQERAKEMEAKRELEAYQHDRHKAKAPKSADFQEEEVKLQRTAEHDTPSNIQEKETALYEKKSQEDKVTTRVEKPKKRSPELEEEKKEEKMNEAKEEKLKEAVKAEVKYVKESPRLPTRRLNNGRRICETPECAMAAAQISESLDLSADPCTDFYQFACGGWMDKHPVPESGATGTFYEARDVMDKRLHQILEARVDPGTPAPLHMLHTFYETCKDTDALDALGLAPLESALATAQGGWPMVVDTWDPDIFSLTTALNSLRTLNVYPLLGVGVDLDLQYVSTRILYVDAGTVPMGISLMENPGPALLEPYTTFMTTAAKLLRDHMGSGVTDQEIQQQVQEVIDFEAEFSQMVFLAANETTNSLWRTDVTGLQTDTDAGTPGQFNWLGFLKEMFTKTGVTITTDEPVISFKGTFFGYFSTMLANTNPRVLANALGWWWAFELQLETTYAMRNASFDFYHDVFGITEPSPRWQHCVDESNVNLGFALSREYVDQYMAVTVRPETTEMVEDLREAFSTLMDNNTWMLPQDLTVAREKLAAIDPFVAYPDWIMDDAELTLGYEGLNLVSGDQVGNLERIGSWFNRNSLASLREVPEHSFLMPPTIVNAFYNPQENTITILAGILQPPFYSHNSLAALNYGGIGMVIGHELTHGFDISGRLFDKDGNLVQWWSNETITAYNERAVCFVDQYNRYVPPELSDAGLNISIKGQQTLGENIADNGGMREAFRAYQIYVNHYGEEARLPGLDEFSPNHLFYLGFANEWCEHKDAEAVLSQLGMDVHSPGRFRVLGPLSNDEEFSMVWNCPVDSPMNRGDERCILW